MPKPQRSITYSEFELTFTNYVQPPDVAALRQAFVGVKKVSINKATKTARVFFQQKGQAKAAYEATFNSETRTGIYDRVVAVFMPGASFGSMEDFSQALGAEMSKQRQQRKGAPEEVAGTDFDEVKKSAPSPATGQPQGEASAPAPALPPAGPWR